MSLSAEDLMNFMRELKGTINNLEDVMTRKLDSFEDRLAKLEEKTPSPFENATSPVAKRSSNLFNLDSPPVSEKDNPPATMITEYKVQENEQMSFLSAKSYRYAKDKYELYRNTSSDKSRRLVHFIRQDIQKALVDNELRLCTELSATLNYNRIHELSDENIQKMVARKLRPITETDYRNQMLKSITPFKPVDSTYDKLEVKNYDISMHQPVCRLLQEFADFDELFRLAATPDEIAQLPKMEYGKDSKPGVFRIALHCTGKYAESFKNFVTEEKLKTFKSFEEFDKHLRSVNDKLSTQAIELRRTEVKLQPLEKLADIPVKTYTTKGSYQRQQVPGDVRKHDGRLQSVEEANRVKKIDFEEGDELELAEHFANSYDDSFEEDAEPTDHKPDNEVLDDMYRDLLAFNSNGKDRFKAPNKYPAKTPEKDSKQMPCYDQFYHKTCAAGANCKYSHDPAVLIKHGRDLMEKLKASPYMKDSFGKVAVLASPDDSDA